MPKVPRRTMKRFPAGKKVSINFRRNPPKIPPEELRAREDWARTTLTEEDIRTARVHFEKNGQLPPTTPYGSIWTTAELKAIGANVYKWYTDSRRS